MLSSQCNYIYPNGCRLRLETVLTAVMLILSMALYYPLKFNYFSSFVRLVLCVCCKLNLGELSQIFTSTRFFSPGYLCNCFPQTHCMDAFRCDVHYNLGQPFAERTFLLALNTWLHFTGGKTGKPDLYTLFTTMRPLPNLTQHAWRHKTMLTLISK